MKRPVWWFALAFCIIFTVVPLTAKSQGGRSTATCGIAQPAFCETFDRPDGSPETRSGDLNATLWGVSRVTTAVNTGQGQFYDWFSTGKQSCGGGANVFPDADVRICNGQLVEAVNDGHNQTILAMYPKQPWDIAGRTGVATFDVSDDTQGAHAAWPEFWYTDQPIPAPNGDTLSGVATTPRNGFGISLAGICQTSRGVTVNAMTIVTKYMAQTIPFTQDGCMRPPTAPGQLNHVELRLSAVSAIIYGTDAGTSGPLILLAHAAFPQPLPLSRGLIWIEDVHYNACKFDSQCDHAFTWDNVGFDGPVLPRDLTFDVPESKIMRPGGTMQIGWNAPTSRTSPLTLTIPNVTNVAQAQAAALLLSFGAMQPTAAISYSLNGSAWMTQTWPFGSQGYAQRSIALPVPLQAVVAGANTVRIAISEDNAVANVDLLLVGAGGSVAPATDASPTATASPAATATATATSTPTATPTDVPTTAATATPTATDVPGTATPTDIPATVTATPTPTPAATATAVPPTPVPVTCRVSVELNGTPGPYRPC